MWAIQNMTKWGKRSNDDSSRYTPLNPNRQEIRILHLHPAASLSDPVQCELKVASLRSLLMPRYEAISYVWSEHVGTASITLNNTLVEDVPASAVNVLQQFRLKSAVRKLWIDAICINQADNEERSSQVAIMNKIYRWTERTLIWLGEEDETTERLFQDLETISTSIYPQCFSGDRELREGIEPDKVMGQSNIEDFQAVVKFFGRSWFSRVWVLQESLLAARCICRCGRQEIDWVHVCRAAYLLAQTKLFIETADNIGQQMNVLGLAIPVMNLEPTSVRRSPSLLGTFYRASQRLEVTNPHDRFYAIHGLSTVSYLSPEAQNHWGVQIDYERPIAAVLRDAFRFVLTGKGEMNALHDVEPIAGDTQLLNGIHVPSWAPRWDIRSNEGRTIAVDFFENVEAVDNHEHTLNLIEADVRTNRLVLRGFEVDRVAGVFPAIRSHRQENEQSSNDFTTSFLEDRTAELVGFFQACLNFTRERENTSLAKEMLLSMASTKSFRSFSRESTDEDYMGLLEKLGSAPLVEALAKPSMADVITHLRESGVHISESDVEYFRAACEDVIFYCRDRQLFWTDQRRIGLGHYGVAPGDLVVAFLGSNVPFVLRPNGNQESLAKTAVDPNEQASSWYRLLGGCFMHTFVRCNEMEALVQSGEGLKTFDIW